MDQFLLLRKGNGFNLEALKDRIEVIEIKVPIYHLLNTNIECKRANVNGLKHLLSFRQDLEKVDLIARVECKVNQEDVSYHCYLGPYDIGGETEMGKPLEEIDATTPMFHAVFHSMGIFDAEIIYHV